jgi:tetratricopeptide (TPR) repeat protein
MKTQGRFIGVLLAVWTLAVSATSLQWLDKTLDGCVDGGRFYSAGEGVKPTVYLHEVVRTERGGVVDLRPYDGKGVRLRGALGTQDQIVLAEEHPPEVTAESCPAGRRIAILEYDDVFRMLTPDESYARGLRQIGLGFYRAAVVSFDAVLARAPDSARAFFGRGLANARAGKHKLAVADYERAIEMGAARAEHYAALCQAQVELDLRDAAMASCDRALALDPVTPLAYAERGVVHRRRGDSRAALADYDASLRLAPDDEVVLTNRAGLLMEMGDLAAARRDLRRALELDPHHLWARERFAEVERKIAQKAESSAPVIAGPPPARPGFPDARTIALLRRLPHFQSTARTGLEITRTMPMPQAQAPALFLELRWSEAGEAVRGLALVAATAQPPPEGAWLVRDGPWGIAAFEPRQDWGDLLASLREGQYAAWSVAARGRVHEVVRAQSEFASRVGQGLFAAELRCLVEPRVCGFASSERFLDPAILGEEWHGYRYALDAGGRERSTHLVARYAVAAVAVDVTGPWSSYCAEESGRFCEVPTHVPFRIRAGACPLRCLPPD